MPDSIQKDIILDVLQQADCNLQGQFVNGSNYTFFLDLNAPWGIMQAVYKPVRGETPLWDFPTGSLAKREVAAYLVSEALGWNIVPPTVFRKRKLPFGSGSIQEFIDHDPQHHYFNLTESEKQRLKPVALFDILINNADRKGSHILQGSNGRVYCIDHGICFHIEDKLRTVIWDFAGQPIPPTLLDSLARLVIDLEPEKPLTLLLHSYLRKREITALSKRALILIETGVFPQTDNSRRQFPWPPV
jgi:uncharacterized repeat protein (TIGR03843 family)